jgi:hypothetical protein
MQHRKEPGAAHQSLMRGLRAVVEQHGANGMPGVERIAVLAQLIGQEIHDLPRGLPFGPAEILQSVAANIEAGNRKAAGGSETGLLGFGARTQ